MGHSAAPYGIGVGSATEAAEKQSQSDLQQRLATESELVPCPKCNWINDELIRGYRLSRYRRLGLAAIAISLFGAIGSLFAAWFISIGPAADRRALPYFLIGGPIVSIGLCIALYLLRAWRRSCIQPNYNFPLAPELPPGSPPALIVDDATGRLRLATPQTEQHSIESQWHEFQVGRHQLPANCCECLNPTTQPEESFELVVAHGVKLAIPRCRACSRRNRQAAWRIWIFVTLPCVMASTAILIALGYKAEEFWVFFGMCLLISMVFAAFIASAFTSSVERGNVDASRGTVLLKFRHPCYRPASHL